MQKGVLLFYLITVIELNSSMKLSSQCRSVAYSITIFFGNVVQVIYTVHDDKLHSISAV